MNDKPAPPEGKPEELSCTVCGESLRTRRVVRCSRCKTLHHLECWRFNKGCSMYACGCRSWEEAPADITSLVPERFDRQVGVTPARTGAIISGILALYLAIGTVVCAFAVSFPMALIPGLITAILLPISVRYGMCRESLRPDVERKALGRTLELFGLSLARQDTWLTAAEVVELQLHCADGIRGASQFILYALTTSGARVLLRRDIGLSMIKRTAEMEQLVEQLAVFFDCTVRRMEGNTPPTRAEIGEAIAQKRVMPAPPVPRDAAPEVRDKPNPEQRPEKAM